MKALTIRQPWAWLICHSGKRIENRGWAPAYRGPLLIHAGKACTTVEVDDARAFLRQRGLPVPSLAEIARAPLGAVVAEAELVDVVRESEDPWFVGPVGWVLEGVRVLERPVPARGAQGLFDLAWELPEAPEVYPAAEPRPVRPAAPMKPGAPEILPHPPREVRAVTLVLGNGQRQYFRHERRTGIAKTIEVTESEVVVVDEWRLRMTFPRALCLEIIEEPLETP